MVNEVRFQYARETRPRLSNSTVPNFVTSFGSYGAAGSSTSSFLPNEEHDTRYQVTEALTWVKGNHNFKFGGEYSHIDAAQTFGFNQFGRFNMSTGRCVRFGHELYGCGHSVTPLKRAGCTGKSARIFGEHHQ